MEAKIRETMGRRRDHSAVGDALSQELGPMPSGGQRPKRRLPFRLDGRLERLARLAEDDPVRFARLPERDQDATGAYVAAREAHARGGA